MNLHEWDWLLVNSSGGKDSQAMLDYVVTEADKQGYPRKQIVVVHSDLGRAEWEGTKELAQEQAEHYGLRFIVTKHNKGDLLWGIERRGKFPGPATRYCTSDWKRGPIRREMTKLANEWHGDKRGAGRGRPCRILNCMGLRSEESTARAKKPSHSRSHGNSRREVWDWLPIQDWSEDEVWARIRQSGVRHHRAYDLGMPRLSCVFCIFAPKAALMLAGEHNPELLDEYVEVEDRIGHTFKSDLSLRSVRDDLRRGERGEADGMTGCWNM